MILSTALVLRPIRLLVVKHPCRILVIGERRIPHKVATVGTAQGGFGITGHNGLDLDACRKTSVHGADVHNAFRKI